MELNLRPFLDAYGHTLFYLLLIASAVYIYFTIRFDLRWKKLGVPMPINSNFVRGHFFNILLASLIVGSISGVLFNLWDSWGLLLLCSLGVPFLTLVGLISASYIRNSSLKSTKRNE